MLNSLSTFDLNEVPELIWKTTCAIFFSIIGYFFPIRDIVHVVVILFILDVIFGYWAARKLRKEHFRTDIIWAKTAPRMLISIVIIGGCFAWDSVFNQTILPTYSLVGWFISGVLIFSIAKNGYLITNWEMFPLISKILQKKIEEQTGVDMTEKQ